jgi:hypothetical protein
VRGCLFVLSIGVALLAAGAWFGAQPIATAAIGAVLGSSGFHAASSTISATADPPPRLLLGHADRISVTGSDVDWRALHADRLTLTLDDVDLLSRTAGSIHGSVDGAELDDGAGGTAKATSIDFAGRADAAETTVVVAPGEVRAAIVAAAAQRFGIQISDVRLAAPNRLQLVTSLATLDGTLSIDGNGALALDTPLGSIPILSIDPSLPLRLDSVAVVDGALHLTGTLDAEALLRG